ncbi:unnamed protein product [Amoebophrya sp. A120]|nr:unnamed protein product [Amoebophrya sp. A120]|eukprot:GSA120T00005715001.1
MTMEMAVKLQAKLDELDNKEDGAGDAPPWWQASLFWWIAGGVFVLLAGGVFAVVYYFCVIVPGMQQQEQQGPGNAAEPASPYDTLATIYEQQAAKPEISSFELAQYPATQPSVAALAKVFASGKKEWETWVAKTYKAVKLYEEKCTGAGPTVFHANAPDWCDATKVAGKAKAILEYDVHKAAGYGGVEGVFPLQDQRRAAQQSVVGDARQRALDEEEAADVAVFIQNLGGLEAAQRVISQRMTLEGSPVQRQQQQQQDNNDNQPGAGNNNDKKKESFGFPFAFELVDKSVSVLQRNTLWEKTLVPALTSIDPRFAKQVRAEDGTRMQDWFASVVAHKKGMLRDSATSGNPTLQEGLHNYVFEAEEGAVDSPEAQEKMRKHSLSYYQKLRLVQAARGQEVRKLVTKTKGDVLLDQASFAYYLVKDGIPNIVTGWRIRRQQSPRDAGLTFAGSAFGSGALKEPRPDEMLDWPLFAPHPKPPGKEVSLNSARSNLGEEKCNEAPLPQSALVPRGRSSAFHRLCWKPKVAGDHLSPMDTWTPHLRIRRDLVAGPFWTLGGTGPKTFFLVPLPRAALQYMTEFRLEFKEWQVQRVLRQVRTKHSVIVADMRKRMEGEQEGHLNPVKPPEAWYDEFFLTPDYADVLDTDLDFAGYWVYQVADKPGYEPGFMPVPYRSFEPVDHFSWTLGTPSLDGMAGGDAGGG